jgi:hypothetical protein
MTVKKTLKETCIDLIDQNPDVLKNKNYLIMSVWEKQGLQLHPNQREAILNDCSPTASILRAALHAQHEIKDRKTARQVRNQQEFAPRPYESGKKRGPERVDIKTHVE